ncbi:MAG: nucleoside hydrolase [Planctomycetota bacterium]|nr:MAG: nucleoside hydrolase [Planctomycetota bacterium]REJ92967.1 MAG: nucleoside hydrolase [Planctomycetota bacterium]REK30577.1 MAG: nucleoside hydrolase [Planctomycetota bacterium]REK46001.1 MAG: nucleoside hydrolase [Planctomycetota bacterium]
MARKVILDVDPGIDDAVALAMALFDPRLEVIAVTATAGNVSAEQATSNVQAIIEKLDPPRLPRIGAAREPTGGRLADARHIHGNDGLGNIGVEVAELHQRHPSDKVIVEEVRAAPDAVTIVALGPLTNVARAMARDPELATMVGALHMMGGALGAGNVTPAAEFNIYCDPESAQAVFRSPTTKTLVPLDVTSRVVMTYDQLDQLPGELTATGTFMREILAFAFRSHRNVLGLEGIHLHDAVALVAALHPELFVTEELAGDVEIGGELSTGSTIFDRRPSPSWRPNMEVAVDVDASAVMDCILRGLSAIEMR